MKTRPERIDRCIEIATPEETLDVVNTIVGEFNAGKSAFINALVQFVIVAFAIFLVVKVINRFHRKPEEAPAATPEAAS